MNALHTALRVSALLLLAASLDAQDLRRAVVLPAEGAELVEVVSSGLYVRRKPSLDADSVHLVPKGGVLCVRQRIGGFLEVVIPVVAGRTVRGYVARGFTMPVPDPDRVLLAWCAEELKPAADTVAVGSAL